MSLAQLNEVPSRTLIILVGPPGSGKSNFCYGTVLNNLATNRPVIFVTTEYSPSDITHFLQEKGLGAIPSGILNFVDAFHETVGLSTAGRPDTVDSSCGDLTSIEVAISKLQNRIRKKDILLVFDSLTSPYLLNGQEVIKFIRLSLGKFVAEGNSVLVCMDEGCGKQEDVKAMMSIANGIIQMEVEGDTRVLNVVKHPLMKPTTFKFPATERKSILTKAMVDFATRHYNASKSGYRTSLRSEVGDFVNLFWCSYVFWSGMLWDPKRFPSMLFELTKELTYQGAKMIFKVHPWHIRFLWRFLPKEVFRSPRFIKRRFAPIMARQFEQEGAGLMEYLEGISKKDEHYIRIREGSSCWGLENIGAPLCYGDAGWLAGFMKFFDKEDRDWNAVEIACRGQGSPHCEFKVAPEELDEMDDYLTAMDGSKIERIEDRLMEHLQGFLVDSKPLGERPTLGSGIYNHSFLFLSTLPSLASERYRMAIRMAGAMAGKRLGEQLMNLGLRENEGIGRMIDLLEYCKVGKVSMEET